MIDTIFFRHLTLVYQDEEYFILRVYTKNEENPNLKLQKTGSTYTPENAAIIINFKQISFTDTELNTAS